ncbi:hypothetical protein EV182_002211 [Spiromyces aspiralis]|uniref:Uncharacterized protein n=1 Tax=Spiromyces aspiralis TaxID=68401 RepID=A0ACC1HVL6_9FUNG|nr:hypothetical protein EV182_002211 [Spiromyces aspiralis]
MSNPPYNTTLHTLAYEDQQLTQGHKGLATSGALCEAPPLRPATSYALTLPPMFDGKWVEEFLSQYEQYTNALGWTDKQKSTGIHRYLPRMASAIVAHHPETRSGDWAKVKALLINTYHVEKENPKPQDVLEELLVQGFDVKQPDAFLNPFSNITASLHERESTKIAILLKAIPINICEKVIMDYDEEIQTLEEAIRRVREQTKTRQYYEMLTSNINNIRIDPAPTTVTTPSTLPAKDEDMDINKLSHQFAKMVLQIGKQQQQPSSRTPYCPYCDSNSHFRRQCSLLDKDLKNGRVRLINGKVATTNGTILQTNRGQGGIRALMLKQEDQSARVNLISCSSIREQAQRAVLRLTTDLYDDDNTNDTDERTYEVAAQKRHRLDAPPEVVPARKVVRTVEPESVPRTATTSSQPRHNGPTIDHDDEPEAPKNKPQYQYMAPIQEGVDTNSVITQRLQSTEVKLTLKELLAIAPAARREMDKLVTRRRIANDEQPTVGINKLETTEDNERQPTSLPTSRVLGYINGREFTLMIDPGSEVNIMRMSAYASIDYLPIDPDDRFTITNANNGRSSTRGVCHNVPIRVDRVTVHTNILVADELSHDVILGMPWLEAVSWEVRRDDSNTAWVYIHDNKHNTARFRLVPSEGRRRPPVSVNHIHVEHIDEPIIKSHAADLTTMKAKVAVHKSGPPEIQSFVPPELVPSNACEHNYQDDAQERRHEDTPPEDCSPTGISRTCIKSIGELIANPPVADLIATEAKIAAHKPEPSETRPSDSPEHTRNNVCKPIDSSTQGNRNLEPNDAIHDIATLHPPQRESITEHLDRTLCNITCTMQCTTTRCMMHSWSDAAKAIPYTQQRQPINPIKGATPYSQWFGRALNNAHFRTLGCATYHQAIPYGQPFDQTPENTHRRPTETCREPDNTDTAIEGQELFISDTTAKSLASHTAGDEHSSNEHSNDECLNGEHSNNKHPGDEHRVTPYDQCPIPSAYIGWDKALNENIATYNVKSNENRICRDFEHADTNAERQELTTTDETTKHPTNRATDDAHPTDDPTCEDVVEAPPLTATAGSTISNELWIEQVAFTSTEDEHLGATMIDQTTTADADQDYYLQHTHYLLDDQRYPESTPEPRQSTRNVPSGPSDTALLECHHTRIRCENEPTPKQKELYKITEQFADDVYCLAEFGETISDDTMSGDCLKWLFMEDPEEPIAKDLSFGLGPPGCRNNLRHSDNRVG